MSKPKRKISMFWNWMRWQCKDEDEFTGYLMKLLGLGEVSICDICGKRSWFRKCVIYYIDEKPKLLCPGCAEIKERAIRWDKLA